MSSEKKQGSKVEILLIQAKQEGRTSAWDYLNDFGGCTDSENPYDGIAEL